MVLLLFFIQKVLGELLSSYEKVDLFWSLKKRDLKFKNLKINVIFSEDFSFWKGQEVLGLRGLDKMQETLKVVLI